MSDREPPIDEASARGLLRRERERIESALADRRRVRISELNEIDTELDPLDDGARIEEVEIDDALAAQLRDELEAVARAENRLEEGTYGFSIESGEPIPAKRLEAIPWAERTQEEQERYERTHGRSF